MVPAQAQPVPAQPAEQKPAPKPAPTKPTEFRLHCYLCGSLLYARLDQVGTTIKCHDCHAANEVKPPRPQDMQTASDGPRLDDAEEFALSPTFERPKFESLEVPRPDEDTVDEGNIRPLAVTPTQTATPAKPGADAGMVELFSLHGTQPPATPAPRSPVPPATPRPADAFPPPKTAAPAQAPPPPRTAPNVANLFPAASQEPARVRKHEDTYGDELWNKPTDTSRPAFERSPFVVGIVEFLFHPGTLVRWLTLVALASIPTAVLQMVSGAVENTGSLFSGSALLLLFFAAVLGIPWLAVFGAHAMSIVRDTARGRDLIEDWPLGGFLPRGNPIFLPISAALAMVPGGLVFIVYYLSREDASIRGPMMLLVSSLFFMPLLWLPMLLEKSPLGPLQSQSFWQSFRYSGNGWILFYFETFLLALVAAGGMSHWSSPSPVLAPLSAVALITPLFLYFRLLGRLLWYIDPDMAPPPPPQAAAPPPLPDTVDPTQYRAK